MNEGKQTGTVLQHSLGKSMSEAETPYVHVLFQLEPSEEKIPGRIYLSQKAMGMARKSLKAIGFDPDKQNIGELQSNPVLLAGNKAELDIREETYKGNTTFKVAFINPLAKPVDPASFDALTKALREAKKDDEDDVPNGPAVQHIPKEERRQLQKQAKDEKLPF